MAQEPAHDARTEYVSVYDFQPEIDVPIMTMGALGAMSYLLRHQIQPPTCAPLCDENDINGIDRFSAGRFDRNWRRGSDIGIGTLVGGAVATMFIDEPNLAGFEDFLVFSETLLVTGGASVSLTYAFDRPRPFMYGENAPLDEREDGNGGLSFPSGHTAQSFAAAVSLFHLWSARHPRSTFRWVILGVGLAGATFVAASRVAAGDHFVTDVMGGAALGSSLGWLVPTLHRRSPRLGATVESAEKGAIFVLRGAF